MLLYLLLGLLQLLLQLHQPVLELIDPSKNTNPLLFQVTQLMTTCTGVLMLQKEENIDIRLLNVNKGQIHHQSGTMAKTG